MEALFISSMMLRGTPTRNHTIVVNAPMEDLLLMKDGLSFGQGVAMALMEVPPLTTAMRTTWPRP